MVDLLRRDPIEAARGALDEERRRRGVRLIEWPAPFRGRDGFVPADCLARA